MAGISYCWSLFLPVIRCFTGCSLAVISSPLLAKSQRFCGRDPTLWLFFWD
jgi:hypothetical protein